jgi:hypothetical protein
VAIARMLARRVECVIADEPTANLDPVLTADAMRLFRTLAGRVPVIIITHDPDVAGACDRIIVLQSAVDSRAPAQPAPLAAPSRRTLVALGVCAAAAAVTAGALYLSLTTSPPPRHATPAAAKTVHHLRRASPPPSAPLTKLSVCTTPAAGCQDSMRSEPPVITLDADGNAYAKDLTWTGWNTTTAQGTGTLEIDNCQPDCADGTVTGYPATVTASDLMPYGSNGAEAYTSMTVFAPTAPAYQTQVYGSMLP